MAEESSPVSSVLSRDTFQEAVDSNWVEFILDPLDRFRVGSQKICYVISVIVAAPAHESCHLSTHQIENIDDIDRSGL